MCGLAAIFQYSHSILPVDRAELLRIREAMLNRGPDGEGLWISEDRRIGLAHRRLAIVDLSAAGAQPMATADGWLRIVFNGEIYNFEELRRGLEAKGHRFRSSGDTEVLLHLYQEHGRDMVQHLRGMYAFAIWDERKRGIFLARDPFGIKPLYYADDGRSIRIASQVKALLAGGEIDTLPEPAGYVGFYLWGHVPEPYTVYRGVRALPAGCTLWVDSRGRPEIRQFFHLADELAEASDARLTLTSEELRERLHAALLDSVRCHLVSDVPVGIFLSAGLDSTTLTGLAKEALPSISTEHRGNIGTSVDFDSGRALRTVTLGFREFQGTLLDEVPLAELAAHHYGTTHHTRWVTKADFQREYQSLRDAMDQPTTDGINSYFVSKAASDIGLKVAFSGLGGDEMFAGYPSFRQIPRMARLFAPFLSVPSLGKGFRYASAPILKYLTSPKYAGLLEYGGSYGGAYLLRRGMFMPWELPALLDGDMVKQGWEELQTLARLEQTTQGVEDPRLKVAALEKAWYMRNQLLRDADWAGMAHGVELRVPLVDIGLFRAVTPLLSSNCPPGKRAMAAALQTPLPEPIVNRRKTGFAVPLREWLWSPAERGAAERGLRGWARHILCP